MSRLCEFISFDALREAGERTPIFGPLGVCGKLDPGDAGRFQQEIISLPALVSNVVLPLTGRSGKPGPNHLWATPASLEAVTSGKVGAHGFTEGAPP